MQPHMTDPLINSLGSVGSFVSGVFAMASAVGVYFVWLQLKVSEAIAQTQFEDGLTREYRVLIGEIPTKALMGEELSDNEFERCFDEMYHYVDLCNEQVSLRMRGRIGLVVWTDWCAGIKSNLTLPSFKRAWTEIKNRTDSFAELRKLEQEDFGSDPAEWTKA